MRAAEVIADRFVIERLAAEGGMGAVYRALDQATGEPVAVKLIRDRDPLLVERFSREARVLAEITHPHVVRYVAHGVTAQGEPFLAMEWLVGEDLDARLARGPLSIEDSVTLVREAAGALAAAHARGVVHRDIKPSNLFLVGGEPGQVKVLDFGIAQVTGASRALTSTGAFMGTPGYMSPEQARGERERLDARTDVFSLGAVLYASLTGKQAFGASHVMAILTKLLIDEPPRVRDLRPEVPARLDDLVARMLHKSAEQRPADGAAVAAMLEQILPDAPEPAAAPPPRFITGGEQRLLSLVVIVHRAGAGSISPEESTAAQMLSPERADDAREIAALMGGAVHALADGSILVTVAEDGSATDQAARAARCALRLRRALPDAVIALVTGRGKTGERLPVGQVVEQAAAMLEGTTTLPGAVCPVLTDGLTRALLDARFEVIEAEAGYLLVGEQDIGHISPLLLGKPSPCVGRDRELRILRDIMADTFDEGGGAQVVLVTAPPGMGKSRLRHELTAYLRKERPEVTIEMGRADVMRAGTPFGLLASVIRHAASSSGGEPVTAVQAKILEVVTTCVEAGEQARVAAFLGELVGAPFPADATPDLGHARKDAAPMEDHVTQAYCAFMRGVYRRYPMLLVLEDVHWADAATIKLVDRVLDELCEERFLVLALARPSVHDTFPRLWSNRRRQEIGLAPLSRRAAEQLVRSALGSAISPAETALLVERAEGNAFYLEELIRAHAEGGAEALPETVLGMVEARLAALPGEARRLLRAASVLGEPFWKGGVLSLLGEAERAEAEQRWLPWLVDNELLTRRGRARIGGEEEYAFRHALLREGAYAMLLPADRMEGHRLAAEWLSRGGSDEHDAVIAEHFAKGEAWEQASIYFGRAGDAASKLGALVETRQHYEAALAALARLPDTDEPRRRRVETVLALVGVSYVVDPIRNLALLTEAESIAETLPDVDEATSEDRRRLCRVQLWIGRCHAYRGAPEEALPYYQRVLASARVLKDEVLIALSAGAIGRMLNNQGYFTQSLEFIEESFGPLERSGNWPEWTLNTGMVSAAVALRGHHAAAVEMARRALDRAEENRKTTSISLGHMALGMVELYGGDPEQGREHLRLALDAALRSGDRVYTHLSHALGAWAESRLDRHEEARAEMECAKEIAAGLDQRIINSDYREAIEVEIAARAGRFAEAIALAAPAVARFRAEDRIFAEAIAQRAWGATLTAQGTLAGAEEHLRESVRLFELGDARMEAARSRRELGRVLAQRGDHEGARALYEAAAAQLSAGGAAAEAAAIRAGSA